MRSVLTRHLNTICLSELKIVHILVCVLLLSSTIRISAQTYESNVVVQTFAGSGFYGLVNGVGTQTMFYGPSFLSSSGGSVFVWDSQNAAIRAIDQSTNVSTFIAGNFGVQVFGLVCAGTNTIFTTPGASQLYIDLSPISGYSVTGNAWGICFDGQSNLYYSDRINNKIYRFPVAGGASSIFAGSGNPGSVDGKGIFDSFFLPSALTCDTNTNVFVWDSGNDLVRKIDQASNVTTIAGRLASSTQIDGFGTNAGISGVSQIAVDTFGNLLLACSTCVRKISQNGNVTTLAGSFTQSGFVDNTDGQHARFNGLSGICVVGTNIYLSDYSNQRIRVISYTAPPPVPNPADIQIGIFPGLTITGTVGHPYQIQSSPDLANWTAIATITLTSNSVFWVDQNPIAGSKFYRAVATQ